MTKLEIEAFLTIIKYGSISQAAEALFITQPALSRRIYAIEQELGYTLFHRKKGGRSISLTEQGKAFIAVAEKMNYLYKEALSISNLYQKPILNIASIGSVSTYLLPNVLHSFIKLENKYNLAFYQYHSLEAYGYVENGMIDVALISNVMYAKKVFTIPAFQEPFVFISKKKWNVKKIHPSMLQAENEIRLPWNVEYDIWHEKWFDNSIYPNVHLDQMSLLEYFLTGENWSIVPLTVAKRMNQKEINILPIENAPEDRMIYYLITENKKEELIKIFLNLLHTEINKIDGVKSFLK